MGSICVRLYRKLWLTVRDNYALRERAYQLLTSPRVANNWLYRNLYERRMSSVMARYRDFPPAVSLESSSYCNADCTICAYSKMSRKKGIMDSSLFRRIVDECVREGTERMYLSGFGEPLIDRDLEKKIRYAKERGIPTVTIFTNGSLLSTSRSKGLIEAGLDELNVSMDGLIPATFSRIRRGIDFSQVSRNLKDFVGLRKRRKPVVNIYFVLLDENRDDIPDGLRKWETMVDKVIVRHPQDWAGEVKEIETPSTPHIPHSGIERPPCHYLWTQFNIYWNGDVPLCCFDFDAKVKLGNIRQSTVSDIWQGKPLALFRETHLERRQNTLPLCNRCSYFSIWW